MVSSSSLTSAKVTSRVNDAEEDLDYVEPRAARRAEMHGDSGVFVEPGPHFGVAVGGLVVADDAQPDPGVGLATSLRHVRASA
jgi:hypothetical protein